jgi:hypothetical protein
MVLKYTLIQHEFCVFNDIMRTKLLVQWLAHDTLGLCNWYQWLVLLLSPKFPRSLQHWMQNHMDSNYSMVLPHPHWQNAGPMALGVLWGTPQVCLGQSWLPEGTPVLLYLACRDLFDCSGLDVYRTKGGFFHFRRIPCSEDRNKALDVWGLELGL